jgi:solute carrier family 25 (mitochondrial folate transporter), member 32
MKIEEKNSFIPPPTWKEIKNHILAGAFAGSMTSLITCPLDVVKTRMQYLPILKEQMNGAKEGQAPRGMLHNLTNGKVQKPYKGTLISLRRIWFEEGFRGLYRGLGPTLLGYLPTFSIYFPAYHNYKYYLAKCSHRSGNDPLVHLVSAIGAGATSSFTTNPFWLIRTRLMTQSEFTPYFYWNSLHAFKSIYQHEGIRGLYKGLGPAALGLFHVAVQFPLYEKAKNLQKLNPNDPEEVLKVHQILIASTGSKVVASVATYPHEVLRTRFQNQTTSSPKYVNIPQAIQLIWLEEGFKGFYRGMLTSVMRVVPASAVTLITYEKVLQFLKSQ